MTPFIFPKSLYQTEFPVVQDQLLTIMHMAPNQGYATVSRKVSAFWLSEKCAKIRDALLQPLFFKTLKIHPRQIPLYLRNKLMDVKVQSVLYRSSFVKLYLDTHKNDDIFSQHGMLKKIKMLEKNNDWITSYLLAHALGTAKNQSLYRKNQKDGKCVFNSKIPFLMWLVLLQKSDLTESLMDSFIQNLPFFKLDTEGKIFCAVMAMNIYRAATLKLDPRNATKTKCLIILDILAMDPLGRKAILEANGLQFLMRIANSYNCSFCFSDHEEMLGLEKYAIAKLLQNEIAQKEMHKKGSPILADMLLDLAHPENCFSSCESMEYFTNLISVLDSLYQTRLALVKSGEIQNSSNLSEGHHSTPVRHYLIKVADMLNALLTLQSQFPLHTNSRELGHKIQKLRSLTEEAIKRLTAIPPDPSLQIIVELPSSIQGIEMPNTCLTNFSSFYSTILPTCDSFEPVSQSTQEDSESKQAPPTVQPPPSPPACCAIS